MDSEIQRLARAAAAGDYLAVLPLRDRLHDLSDWRLGGLDEELLELAESIAPDEGGDGPSVPSWQERRAWNFRRSIRRLFWLETGTESLAALLNRAASMALEHERRHERRPVPDPEPPTNHDPA